MMELEGEERKGFISGAWRGVAVGLIWAMLLAGFAFYHGWVHWK
jgi:hypothetical protein